MKSGQKGHGQIGFPDYYLLFFFFIVVFIIYNLIAIPYCHGFGDFAKDIPCEITLISAKLIGHSELSALL